MSVEPHPNGGYCIVVNGVRCGHYATYVDAMRIVKLNS